MKKVNQTAKKFMNTHKIDIGGKDIDIYVDGKLVLNIGQVSDNEVINLFFTPKSNAHFVYHEKQADDDPVVHEMLAERVERE